MSPCPHAGMAVMAWFRMCLAAVVPRAAWEGWEKVLEKVLVLFKCSLQMFFYPLA